MATFYETQLPTRKKISYDEIIVIKTKTRYTEAFYTCKINAVEKCRLKSLQTVSSEEFPAGDQVVSVAEAGGGLTWETSCSETSLCV